MAAPNNLRGLEVSVNDAATTIGPISVIGLNEVRFAAYAMTGEYMGGTGGGPVGNRVFLGGPCSC